ncbi:MBL fold metallo-hydrolase [Mesonia maritima]|uniref:L-ascorbate metabolism protein UlaG (Beta-lactamase superfamily) n=1 Tax=Mesonia maritima TaxID=1793873 RepID=A0ABU1K1R0_9FLAO|nr:MBL fold metallo-hydrolase [Mesonia maritima]MDR6299527.1 L-ascorbate metabolism protein UlaG (beta-lactamase superfamily) [Mesonia maritima]
MKIIKNPNITSSVVKDGVFQNIEETPQMAEEASVFKILKKQFSKPKNVQPSSEIPIVKTDLINLAFEKPTIVWFGHSSYLIRYRKINILVDPVFCGYASPFPFMIKSFAGANNYGVEDMPIIDYHIQTHNHYDHLDKKSLKSLAAKTKNYIVPKGVKKDLLSYGISSEKITELDWGERAEISSEFQITATPARHFSGRGLKRNASLWSSYVLEMFGYRFFLGGDSGFGNHFQQIGDAFGQFDLAILECGQYGEYWPHIHTFPKELLKIAETLQAKYILPVHWAKFALAHHPWKEPIERLLKATENSEIQLATPRVGEPLVLGENYPTTKWWENLD